MTRQTVLRLAELQLWGEVEENSGILMDAPTFFSVGELIWMAGGSGSEEDIKTNRKRWKEWCMQKLCTADRERQKQTKTRVAKNRSRPTLRKNRRNGS